MKEILIPSALLFLLALSACRPGRHAEMRRDLAALQALNQADSVLTDDSLAQALADWFDRHGTPNEQMEAHYLLGRTHADRGEAPAALAAYHDAIDRADTTAEDCDYGQLCRVYIQMAYLFYQQMLIPEQIECLNTAIDYSQKTGDSILELNARSYKMAAFDRKGDVDSVIAESKKIAAAYTSIGYKAMAAQCLGFSIKSLLERGDYAEALHCIRQYDRHSGYFDSLGNIEKGREAYYNTKGLYFFYVHQYDSAEYYFRKELTFGKDFNNQNMGSKGMATLFQQTGNTDSAAKYALYSYAMNDSVYAQMATREVENIQGMYDYSRLQKLAEKEKAEKEKAEQRNTWFFRILLFIFVLAAFVSYIIYRRKKRAAIRYSVLLGNLAEEQSMVLRLRTLYASLQESVRQKDNAISQQKADIEAAMQKSTDLERLLSEREQKVCDLIEQISKYQNTESTDRDNINKTLYGHPTHQWLQKKVDRGCSLTDEEWSRVDKLILDILPRFNHFIMQRKYALTDIQYHTCILLRLGVSQASIGKMHDVSPSYISQVCKTTLRKLFGQEGTGADLQRRLIDIR